MARLLFAIGIISITFQVGYSTKYDNHTLIRLYPAELKQVEILKKFEDPQDEVEILKESRGVNDSLDILVPPARMQFVEDLAKKENLTLEVKQTNYGRALEDIPETDRTPRRRILRSFSIYSYNSHANMQGFIDAIAKSHPHLVTHEALGNSFQGRPMRLVKISKNPKAGNPVIFVDGGIHAREWVASSMAIYLIHRLVTDEVAGKGGELDGLDWWILPLVNPDGYEYSRASKSNRLWRKTRSRNGGCFGVDGNRNYGFKWGVSGVSKDCNRETFAGARPFSEPETEMVKNIMLQNANRIKLYVSLHSYGQYLVYPWGYTGEFLPKEWRKLDDMAQKVSRAVVDAGGKPFKVLSAGKWYPAAGGSDDFAFGAAGIPYSYTMELTEGFEFTFPENMLRSTLPQFYEGFRMFASEIRKEFGHQRKRREISFLE